MLLVSYCIVLISLSLICLCNRSLFFFFLMTRPPPRSTRLTHSFPTRRSSDLPALAAILIPFGEIIGVAAVLALTMMFEPDAAHLVGQDRKSTRLNSSQ